MTTVFTKLSITNRVSIDCARRTALLGQLRVPNLTSRHATNSAVRGKLPPFPARTRFAPSPTGLIHLGSLRTALFNYLLARKTKGKFLLRLEDTDRKRTVPGAEDNLYDALRWAGLQWDEGPVVGGPHGPYRQSERTSIYQTHINALLATGKAYRCFCSSGRLDNLNRRRHEKGLGLGYDRKCAHLTPEESTERAYNGEASVVRFWSPDQWPRYTDLVYGKTGHGSEKSKKMLIDEPVWEDVILIKSDGFPTYHWANVCDDYEMKITHVVRGSEWMSSTPLHVALYQSMGWRPPIFAHVPLLVNRDGQKLSKRNSDSATFDFRSSPIFPEALTNFVALLGWSHQGKSDVMDLKDLEERFDMKITKGNTVVSFDKLRYLQEHHARRRIEKGGDDFEQIIRDVAVAVLDTYGAGRIASFIGKRNLRDVVASMLRAESLHFRSARDFARQIGMFLASTTSRPLLQLSSPLDLKHLNTAASTLCLTPDEMWTKEIHRSNLRSLRLDIAEESKKASEASRLWKKELYHYLRWALLGGVAGPSIPETLEILGRTLSTQRIRNAALDLEAHETKTPKPNILKSVLSHS